MSKLQGTTNYPIQLLNNNMILSQPGLSSCLPASTSGLHREVAGLPAGPRRTKHLFRCTPVLQQQGTGDWHPLRHQKFGHRRKAAHCACANRHTATVSDGQLKELLRIATEAAQRGAEVASSCTGLLMFPEKHTVADTSAMLFTPC